MKLRYLFLAACVACVLSSCSDDNNNGIELPDDTMVEANISFIANPQGGTMTKAISEAEGTNAERFVETLTAYVFYADNDAFAGMGVGVAEDIYTSVDEIKNIVVKVKAKGKGQLSETKLKMVLLANVSLGKTPATLSDITKDASFGGIAALNARNARLPMFSEVISINAKILAGADYNNWVLAGTSGVQYTDQKNNNTLTSSGGAWVEGKAYVPAEGDRIELTRHVARVQLESLNADFKNNYSDASFTVQKIYVANASDNSKLYTTTGNTGYGLEKADKFFHGCDYVRDDYFLVSGTTSVSLVKDYGEGMQVRNDNPLLFVQDMARFYVFELSNKNPMTPDKGGTIAVPTGRKINTMLVLEGTWRYATGKESTRFYRIPIRATEGGTEPGVVHNTIYKISATLTGEGSTDPDTEDLNVNISFKVKTENWIVIKQTETDEE